MVEASQVTVRGLTIAYDHAGTGPALVLLHGIGSTPWQHQFEAFADDYTVIAWHAPGYGRSSDPDGEWTMADYADVLLDFLEVLGVARTHLLGQSWGGVLAQEFYRHHPERVRSLILSDTMIGGSAARDDASDLLAVRLHAAGTMTPAEFARARTPQLLAPNPSPVLTQTVETQIAEMLRPSGFRQAAIALAYSDTRDVLARITVPTLVITGEHDTVTPPPVRTRLIGEIPGATLVTIRDAEHLACVEQPGPYNTAVRECLRSVPS